jgi:hypothetical protein
VEKQEAEELLRRAQRDGEEARAALATAEATIESSQLIIQGVLRRFPELQDEPWVNRPESVERPARGMDAVEQPARGMDAVEQVLLVDEDQWFTISKLVDKLAEIGSLPDSANPPNAVRTAVERLRAAEGSNIEKARSQSGAVIYRYHEPEPEPTGGYQSYDEEPF